MARLTAYCRTMSGRTIERDALIPDEYLRASRSWASSA